MVNGYELSRNWFDWCFENPEKISPNHTAIYFFAIEHCNRLGWKEKFGFPTQMAMDALGIKKHNTYIKYFRDLCDWGFLTIIQESKNQYSSNIISLTSALPKNGKALDKAFIKHGTKQTESNGQSNSSIDKQINNKPITSKKAKVFFKDSIYFDKLTFKNALPEWSREKLAYYYEALNTWSNEGNKKIDWLATVKTWERKDVAEGKIKFKSPKNELPKDWWNMELTPEQWELLTPNQRREKKNNDLRKKFQI